MPSSVVSLLVGAAALAVIAPAGVEGHGAMLNPAPWKMTDSFVAKLPAKMQRLLKSGENYGQDIPRYLLQTTPLEFWKEEGLEKPRGNAWTLPCRGVSPDGVEHEVTPGGRLRIKYQIDVNHGGDCMFRFFKNEPGEEVQIGDTHYVKGCGHTNSGVYTTMDVPDEAKGCGKSGKFCFVQFYWKTSKSADQTYVSCATVVDGGNRRRSLRDRIVAAEERDQ